MMAKEGLNRSTSRTYGMESLTLDDTITEGRTEKSTVSLAPSSAAPDASSETVAIDEVALRLATRISIADVNCPVGRVQ